MQALKLKPLVGWTWIRAGWHLFRRQSLAFAALLFFYWLLLFAASAVVGWLAHGIAVLLPFVSADLLAAVGSVLVAMFTPALTVGFMQACRGAEAGQPVHPLLLFAPFRAGKKALRSLLMLGAIQMAALVCIVFLTGGLDTRIPDQHGASTGASQRAPSGTASTRAEPNAGGGDDVARQAASEADQEALRREAIARTIQGLAYLPVALLMWYAPMLAAWHGLPAGKALFFSVVAVWRNFGVFIVFGLGWLAIWMSLLFAIALVAGVGGIGNLAAVLALPPVMVLLTWMYCSVYPSYAMVFVEEAARVDPAPPPS